jgi:CheY-like chemotaxis protein
MKIFFLEDNPDRYQQFYLWLAKKKQGVDTEIDVVTAESADEAYEAFKTNKKFDFIFLDHDLGRQVFVDSLEENTGYRVALYIRDNEIKYDRCIVHSQNPAGAENIKSALPDAELIPFPILIKS